MHVYDPEELYSGSSDEEMGLRAGMTEEALLTLSFEIEESFYQIVDIGEDDLIRGVYEYLSERLRGMEEKRG